MPVVPLGFGQWRIVCGCVVVLVSSIAFFGVQKSCVAHRDKRSV